MLLSPDAIGAVSEILDAGDFYGESVRPSLAVCTECGGKGAIGFDRGPAAEPCTRCRGTGRMFSDPEYRGVFAAMISEGGVFVDPQWRLLLEALNALDKRVWELERGASGPTEDTF
jgi:hypothetical protein